MEGSRERAIERVRDLLESAGFYVSDAHNIRPTSFDLMARRDSLLLIVKVLKNIDALAPEEARRLRELGTLFPATPIVVGQNSGATRLEPGVVYNRYGVTIVVEASLREYLHKGVPPFLFSSPGGIFVRVDGPRLRQLREDRSLSLGALAGIAGVSRRTIQLYEEGTGAEISIVQRIEAFLDAPVALPIDLFPRPAAPRSKDAPPGEGAGPDPATKEPGRAEGKGRSPARTGDALRDGVFRQLDGMGWEVVVTIRCPFDAFTRGPITSEEEILLTTVGSLRSAQHRADVLQQLARVAEGHALFVVRESAPRRAIDGMAVLSVTELKRQKDPDELLETIEAREQA
jgi:putative transcriptional regulator